MKSDVVMKTIAIMASQATPDDDELRLINIDDHDHPDEADDNLRKARERIQV